MATTTKRITAEALAHELARRLETSVGDAERLLEVVGATVAELTQGGTIVELSDLFSLSTSDEDSTWQSTPVRSPRPLAAPGRAIAYFVSRRDDHPLLEELSRYYAERGATLIRTKNGAELLARLERQPASAIVLDGQVDDWRDVVREIKCDPATNAVPVVGLFPASLWHAPLHTVSVQPDEVLVEPVDLSDFVHTRAAELSDPTHDGSEFFTLDMRVPGVADMRGETCAIIAESMFRANLREPFVTDACEALAEALENAWRHGHNRDDRAVIRLRVMLDANRLAMSVADEGAGFSHEAELFRARMTMNRSAESKSVRRRGISEESGFVRMLRQVSRLDFNRTGNNIVLTKYRR